MCIIGLEVHAQVADTLDGNETLVPNIRRQELGKELVLDVENEEIIAIPVLSNLLSNLVSGVLSVFPDVLTTARIRGTQVEVRCADDVRVGACLYLVLLVAGLEYELSCSTWDDLVVHHVSDRAGKSRMESGTGAAMILLVAFVDRN
jgi:hypothetical protein